MSAISAKVTGYSQPCQQACIRFIPGDLFRLTFGPDANPRPCPPASLRYRAATVREPVLYSTSRGALYPFFATTEYFIGLPFSSTIRSGSFVAGFTNCTVIFRNFPSLARFVD